MKNQYFGDVNDYRKYGLLRLLSGCVQLRIGVCWMLTPTDNRPDGKKTEYLNDEQQRKWRFYDPELYDFLQVKVRGHETEPSSRDVKNLTEKHLAGGHFYSAILEDSESQRKLYFEDMWKRFKESEIDLIFFDPDDGLAHNNKSRSPLKKGHRNSAKKLFRDEVQTSLKRGFSVLFYQHFDRTDRKSFVSRIASELASMTAANKSYSFWTPHVAFFLIPNNAHTTKLSAAITRVQNSKWVQVGSCPTSRKNERCHILVGEHH